MQGGEGSDTMSLFVLPASAPPHPTICRLVWLWGQVQKHRLRVEEVSSPGGLASSLSPSLEPFRLWEPVCLAPQARGTQPCILRGLGYLKDPGTG